MLFESQFVEHFVSIQKELIPMCFYFILLFVFVEGLGDVISKVKGVNVLYVKDGWVGGASDFYCNVFSGVG